MTPEQREAAIKEASSDLSNWAVSGEWDKSTMAGLVQKVMAGHHPPKFPAELFFKTLTSSALKFRPAHETLCEVARLLSSAGEPLPLWLQQYVVFAAEAGGARSRRGRSRLTNATRNQAIALAVGTTTTRYGLHPTRNVVTTSECGCSIVVEALKRLDIPMSEANVAAIWQRNALMIKQMPARASTQPRTQ